MTKRHELSDLGKAPAVEPESATRLALDDSPLRPNLLVGESTVFESHVPGISRVAREQVRPSLSTPLTAVCIEFEGLALGAARRSLSWLTERVAEGSVFSIDEHEEEVETIEDPARIRGIISALIASEARGQAMYACSQGEQRRVVSLRVARDGTLLWGAPPASLPPASVEVQMEGFSSVYLFQLEGGASLSPPASMVRVRRRRFRRVSAPYRLRFVASHPLWQEIAIDAQVIDVSEQGLSIETDAVRDVLYPGLKLRSVELRWKGGDSIRGEALIAHVTQLQSTGQHRVGLRLLLSGRDASRWHLELEELLHPRTTRGEPDPRTFWNTYVESGYFQLSGKTEQEFVDEWAAFERSQNQLRAAPDLAAFFAYSSKRRTESVAHQTSVWEGSWVYYHLCRLSERRPIAAADDRQLLDLYAHAYEHVQSRADARWLVTYVQEVARFSRLIFYEIAERYRALGRACIWPFRALEVSCATPSAVERAHAVGPARDHEIRALTSAIRTLRSPTYVEATGLAAPDLSITPAIEQWRTAGLTRERVVLIARNESGSPVAGAVLDAVGNGVHLFGLLDVARFFPLAAGGAAAFDSLLAAARDWFGKLGKRKFTYFADETEDPDAMKRQSVVDLGRAFMTILPVGLLPELLEHVFFVACGTQPAGSPRWPNSKP